MSTTADAAQHNAKKALCPIKLLVNNMQALGYGLNPGSLSKYTGHLILVLKGLTGNLQGRQYDLDVVQLGPLFELKQVSRLDTLSLPAERSGRKASECCNVFTFSFTTKTSKPNSNPHICSST
jgi:hypothetical protein